jgi:hypothetical protein
MVRYWYSLTPLLVILAIIPLVLPWLGLIALMLFALFALAALGAVAWGVVFVSHILVRSIGRRLHGRSGTGRQPATVLAPRPRVGTAQSLPAGAAVLVASPQSESERLT